MLLQSMRIFVYLQTSTVMIINRHVLYYQYVCNMIAGWMSVGRPSPQLNKWASYPKLWIIFRVRHTRQEKYCVAGASIA